MPAQRKEIVFGPHLRHPQDPTPDRRQLRLDIALRRHKGLGHRRGCAWRGQRLAVHLAVRRQREGVQRHEMRRHHMLWQHRRQFGPQARFLRRPHDIGHQPQIAGAVLACQDHSLSNARLRLKHRLNLAQLNAVTAQLHLKIRPAQEIQPPILAQPHQITGLVHPRAPRAGAIGGDKRISLEPLLGQIRPLEIPARHPIAANPQLARRAGRHRVHRLVQHIHLLIGQRRADIGNRLSLAHLIHRRPDRGFRRAIHVQNPRRRRAAQIAHQSTGQRLAPDHQRVHPRQHAARLVVHRNHPRHRRGALQMRHPMADDLRGDGIIPLLHPAARIGALHHLGQGIQPLQHLFRRNAVIHQTGHLGHTDALQLLHPLQRILNRAKEARLLKIPLKRKVEDRLGLLCRELPRVDLHRVGHPRRALERREGPSILLYQIGRRPEIGLHRPLGGAAHLLAVAPHECVQHQGHGELGRIMPCLAQGVVVKCDLARHLINRLAQQVSQHIRPDLPRLAPSCGVSGGRHPDWQFGRHRTRLADHTEGARGRGKLHLLAAPQPLDLLRRGKHRITVGGRRVFRAQHEIIGMPATCHRNPRPPIGQVVDHRPFLGNPHRMMQRHHTRPRPHRQILRHRRHSGPGHRRVRIGPAKGVEMPLRRPDGAEPVGIGKARTFQQKLILLRPLPVVIAPVIERKLHLLRAGNPARRHQGAVFIRRDHHREPARQGPEQLQHRNVERQRRHRQPNPRFNANPLIHPGKEIRHIAMFNHHPLGPPGGA